MNPPPPKRSRTEAEETETDVLRKVQAITTEADLGPALGVEAERRIEVLWTICNDDDDDDESGDEEAEKEGTRVWWKATVVGKTGEHHELSDDEEEEEEEEIGGVKETATMTPPALNTSCSMSSESTVSSSSSAASSPLVATAVARCDEEQTTGVGEPRNEASKMRVPVYEILYDARPPGFPDPCPAMICITGEHSIFDLETGENMLWRFEGDDFEIPSGAEDENDDEDFASAHAAANPVLLSIERELERRMRAEEEGIEEDTASGGGGESFSRAKLDVPLTDLLDYRPSPEVAANIAQHVVDLVIGTLVEKHQREFQNLTHVARIEVLRSVAAAREHLLARIADVLREKGTVTKADAERIVADVTVVLSRGSADDERVEADMSL